MFLVIIFPFLGAREHAITSDGFFELETLPKYVLYFQWRFTRLLYVIFSRYNIINLISD